MTTLTLATLKLLLEADTRQYTRELKKAETVGSKFSQRAKKGFKSIAGGLENIANVAAVVTPALEVLKTAFDFAQEGFALNVAANQFGLLAESIDSTADVLETRLKVATKGLISDAELMASASEIISLGLAKTEDDTIRLATVISTLSLNMEQVILTFANNSKARLDSLGLSITRVDEITQDFVATGATVEDAFDLAVLAALEERVDLLGLSAGAAVDPIEQLTASGKNVADSFKRWLADGLNPALSALVPLVKNLEETDNSIKALTLSLLAMASGVDNEVVNAAQSLNEQLTVLARSTDDVDEFTAAMMGLTDATAEQSAFFFESAKRAQDYERNIAMASAATEEFADKLSQLSNQTIQHITTTVALRTETEEMAAVWGEDAAPALEFMTDATANQTDANNALASTFSILSESANTLAHDSFPAFNASMEDSLRIFDDFEGAEDNLVEAYKTAAFEAFAAANGINESSLQLAVSLGLISQPAADLRLEFVNTMAAVEALAASQEFATLSSQNQAEAIQFLIEGETQSVEMAIILAQANDILGQSALVAGERSAGLAESTDIYTEAAREGAELTKTLGDAIEGLPTERVITLRMEADIESARRASKRMTDAVRGAPGGGGGVGGVGGGDQNFQRGGFTGASGGRVHANEFVFSPPAVDAIGVSMLNELHQLARSGGLGVTNFNLGGIQTAATAGQVVGAFESMQVLAGMG